MAADPLVSLASSIHAGPATFALLLGSGISVSSGVPTGWSVTLDLIRRQALLEEEEAGDDPIMWYRQRAGGEPSYSELLEALAPSLVDRRNLLERYFEPTDDEREEGLKLPTPAHRAIAELVAHGFIKVIVTTNFDRLLEVALAEAGVQPNVIASPDAAAGALPIAHSRATIIKVHGDYLSPDLKNTVDELSGYDVQIDRLLDEVFDQYGLIVCGWSGVWDAALRAAVLRAPGRRFSTFWFHRGPLDPEAQELANHRGAICVETQDADAAFTALAAKVDALSEATDQRPADTALAIAQLKKYLPDPIHRIKLHDLVMNEVEEVIRQVEDLAMNGDVDHSAYASRMKLYEEATAGLLALLATGAMFSDRVEHDQLLARCIERLATREVERGGKTVLLEMQQYPTLLALYALALGAAAADRIEPVALALGSVKVADQGREVPVGVAASWGVLNHNAVKRSIDGVDRRKTPISDHLLDVLRPAVSGIVRNDGQLEDLFDEVEYLLGLSYASSRGDGIGPIGRAAWRSFRRDRYPGMLVARHGDSLVAAGVFKDADHFSQASEAYEEKLKSSPHRF